MTAEPTIDYETLAQEAMRGVVRTVLMRAAKSGLPGDHHFYISFDTEGIGVTLSKRLREKYPREMTIVLQHRFWDLSVSDDRFEVKLTFDGIPERLVIPFAAIKVFFDPSVRYGLQFEDPSIGPDAKTHAIASGGIASGSQTAAGRASQRKARPGRKARAERDDLTPPTPSMVPPGAPASEQGTGAAKGPAATPTPISVTAKTSEQPAAEKPASGGAEIVSLDQFRKK